MSSAASEPDVFVALGSNLGDPLQTLREAAGWLRALSTSPLVCSSVWRTRPIDCPPGSPDFLNAVVGLTVDPATTPEDLLTQLQNLERRGGRKPKRVVNEPRALDLDLLAFRQERRGTPQLILPHPRASERRFVLAPWAEVAPNYVMPGFTATIRQLLERVGDDDITRLELLD